MKNWHTYAIIVIFIVVVFMFVQTNKTMKLQTTLLIGMAKKMGFTAEDIGEEKTERITQSSETQQQQEEETDEQRQIREENDLVEGMIAISEEIREKGILSKKEKKYYTDNFNDMHEDLKLADPSEIIVEEASTQTDVKGNKRLSAKEKCTLILTFFEDNIPKQLNVIDQMLADKTSTQPNKGNTHTRLKEMTKSKQIIAHETEESNVFYVLPEWMDGKKLKKEFLNKIS